MDQSSGSKVWNYFKIPQLETAGNDVTTIGILDSSGSMSSYWKMLATNYNKLIQGKQNVITLTFDTTVRQGEVPTITQNINAHGGGGTSIDLPFIKLNELIGKGSITTNNLTVIFVSDGADGSPSTLEERLETVDQQMKQIKANHLVVNFLCVAVGKGFPTFLAMRFRDMYHTGDTNAPPVFLINTSSNEPTDGVFQEQFELLTPYLGHEQKVQINPGLLKYPWDEEVQSETHANSWLCSQKVIEEVTVKGQNTTVQIKPIQELNIYQVIELAKSWVQFIQLKSLKQVAGPQAKIALEIVSGLRDSLSSSKKQDKKLSFADRMKIRGKLNLDEDLNTLVRELRKFADSELLGKLSEEEAAKRLAIGTVVGKYHSVAMKLKGISVTDYVEARDLFVKLLEQNTFDFINSSQEPSVVLMQNQKDIFSETDFIEGLKMCPTQYDLVETLPIVGHGVEVKRSEGALVNPWMINVVGVARHHKIIDSVSLQQKGNVITLQTGNGETEVINCILPLFNSQLDQDLKPLLQSKLFHIMMTFVTMQNADTCFDTAYAALLANTLVFLIQQPVSSWRDEILNLIYETATITYLGQKRFKDYQTTLLETPAIGLVTEHPDIESRCEDPSKAIFSLFCATKQQGEEFDKSKLPVITQRIICEIIARFYPSETPISNFFELANKEALANLDFKPYVESLLTKYDPNTILEKFYTLQLVKNDLAKHVSALNIKGDIKFDVVFEPDRLYFLKNSKFNLETLNIISKFFTGNNLLQEDLVCYLYHGSTYRNSYERAQQPILLDYPTVIKRISQEKTSAILTNNPIFKDTFEILTDIYETLFIKAHRHVLPMNKNKLKQWCEQHGKLEELNTFKYNTVSDLFNNACMSIGCPHFMVLNPSLSQHLQADMMPAFHKTIKQNLDLSEEQLFEMIREGKCLDAQGVILDLNSRMSSSQKKDFQLNKQEILQSIHEIKESYKKFSSEQ